MDLLALRVFSSACGSCGTTDTTSHGREITSSKTQAYYSIIGMTFQPDPEATITLVLALLSFIGLLVYGRKYIASQNVRAQLDAKDAIIDTNNQTIEAFENRIKALEDTVQELRTTRDSDQGRIRELEAQVDDWEHKYRHLEQYAAPQALGKLDAQLGDLAVSLQRIEARLA
jgi:hypothetical protein